MARTRLPRHAALLAAAAGLAFATPTHAQPERSRATSADRAAAPAPGRVDDPLPIRRITLYRSGVASFERRGTVEGDRTIPLRFRTNQINDILKSMVVLDLSREGRIGGISYGSKEPLARRLGGFAVDISANPSLGQLLNALRGSVVTAQLADASVTGTILGVEYRTEAQGEADKLVLVEYLNLVTTTGIRSVKLALVTSITLADEALNAELGRALAALAEYRADRTKTVDVTLTGTGEREIVVGYVQESPVWKTSYRLVLPDESDVTRRAPDDAKGAASRPTIQGWAIVENTTDDDWRDVDLALVSGRPVSFRMDLYEPLYVARPEVPVPTVPGVMPRIYAGGQRDGDEEFAMSAPAEVSSTFADRAEGRTMAPAAPAPMSKARSAMGAMLSAENLVDAAAVAQARAGEAGELFQFQLDHPVTVERQRSAMLPILAAAIDGRRVSIFNASDGSEHPMRGVELTNSTGLQLMPGPLAIYDGGVYAGDAQIGHVPLGDKRLLAYAVDLDVAQRTEESQTSDVRRARIARGLLELTSERVQTVAYTFTNKDARRPRTLIVEHPRLVGWDLAEPKSANETTESLYRFEVALEPGKARTFKAVQRRTESTQLAVTDFDLRTLLAYREQGKASPAVVEAFQQVARRQAAINDLRRTIGALEKEQNEIATDQQRVRSNMGSIDRASDLYGRYMAKLTEQEGRVETLAERLAVTRAGLATAETELGEFVGALNVE